MNYTNIEVAKQIITKKVNRYNKIIAMGRVAYAHRYGLGCTAGVLVGSLISGTFVKTLLAMPVLFVSFFVINYLLYNVITKRLEPRVSAMGAVPSQQGKSTGKNWLFAVGTFVTLCFLSIGLIVYAERMLVEKAQGDSVESAQQQIMKGIPAHEVLQTNQALPVILPRMHEMNKKQLWNYLRARESVYPERFETLSFFVETLSSKEVFSEYLNQTKRNKHMSHSGAIITVSQPEFLYKGWDKQRNWLYDVTFLATEMLDEKILHQQYYKASITFDYFDLYLTGKRKKINPDGLAVLRYERQVTKVR